MTQFKSPHSGRQRSPGTLSQVGTGLIEVLILVAVLSIGMLAMAKIHTVLLRDGGTSANRAVATSLAQEKLDDLRAYKWVNTTAAGSEGCGNGVFCFTEIGTNLGGVEAAGGTLVFPAGNVTLDNVVFNRTWASVDVPAAPAAVQFKLVTVTVTWTDQNGTGTISLQSSIAPNDVTIASAGSSGAVSSLRKPQVRYTPIGVPDVVPITIDGGQGLKKETSKPLPDVSSKGFSVATQFDAVSYSGSDTTARQQVESYTTVGCVCEFAGSGAGMSPAYYTYVDGSLKVNYPTEPVTKTTGTAPSINGDTQDPLCTTCCRDHHDSTSSAKYDPDRPAADYNGNGNHKHYYFTNASNPALGLSVVQEIAGNRYLEACRFLRVDGVYRLMRDWRLVDLVVMPKDGYLVDSSTALAKYQTYVGDVAAAQAKTDGGTATSFPDKATALESRDLSNRSENSLVQLAARGIYVDRVYTSNGTALDTTFYSVAAGSTPQLSLIPFTEINVTLLASWAAATTTVATVTNEEIKDISASATDYYGTYSRGRVAVASGSGGNTDIRAYMLPGNTGLVGGTTRINYVGAVDYNASTLAASGTITYAGPIGRDPYDHSSTRRVSNALNVGRAASGNTAVSGVIALGNSSGSLASLAVTGTGGAGCTIDPPTGNQTTFSCSVPIGYSGTITVSTSQSGGFVRGSTGVNTCVVALPGPYNCDMSAYGPTARISGTCTGTRCRNAALTISAGTGTTCARETAASNPYCDVPVTPAAPLWSGTITLGSTNTGGSGVRATGILPGSTPAATCGTSETSSAAVTAGPADAPSGFTMCASN